MTEQDSNASPVGPRAEVHLTQVIRGFLKAMGETPGVYFTAAAGGIYLLGFVVVNAYYGSAAAVSFGLLEGKYIAAGLLIVAFSVGPIAAGVHLDEGMFRGMDMGNPHLPWEQRVQRFVVGIFLLFISWLVVVEFGLPLVGAPGAKVWRLPYGMYFVMCTLLTVVLCSGHWAFEGRGARSRF